VVERIKIFATIFSLCRRSTNLLCNFCGFPTVRGDDQNKTEWKQQQQQQQTFGEKQKQNECK